MDFTSFFNSAKNMIATIALILILPVTVFFLPESYSAEKPDEIKLGFSVASDCHVEGTNFETFKIFQEILRDMKVAKDTDAAVFLGDNVMNGQDIESIFFYGALATLRPSENTFVAVGNHDLGNGTGNYEGLRDRFLKYNNTLLGADLDNTYYYRIVNGCYMIFLATESDTVNTAYISDEQYSWLRGVLDEAEKGGNPIFVFSHYPADYLNGYYYYDLVEILEEYENLFYFYGHTHTEFTEASFSEAFGFPMVNLPRTTEHGVDGYDTGLGVIVEVYEDEVVIKGRDFYNNKWADGLEKTYPLAS